MNGINKTPSGIPSGANKPQEGDKKLPESSDTAKVTTTNGRTGSGTGGQVPPAGVVQEDNIASNDHGQADPRNNERSEFEESQAMQIGTVDDLVVGELEQGEQAWTCHPIANYRVGRKYKFDKGILRLTDRDDIDEFTQILKDLPESESHKIRKLDVQAAEKISRAHQDSNGAKTTQSFDSSIGDRGVKPQLGKVDLADAPNGGAHDEAK